MTLTTSGSRSTAARPRTRPATTSRPARAGESRPAAGGAPARRPSASSPASGSSANRTTCCSASARPPTAPSSAGRPNGGRKAADIYAQLLAAEPHATAERKRELRTEAVRKARQSPLFFDLTLSLSKSISIFHASLGENARLARQAGDNDGDAYWSALVGEVDDMIWQAVHAGFGYFQREAGYTRTGSHNTRVHGRETGQWHEADLAVAHWLQHTSRDGDMQLHVHSQIAHVARTSTDGKWRAPDSLGYNEHIGAVAAIVSQHLEEALTARFGLEWTARDDGHGFEIKGISGEMMRVFSSRRESITADLRARAARFEQRYGRAPSQRELAQLAQASNFATRAAKEGALDLRAAARGLGGQARAHARRDPGVGRAVGVARRRQRRRALARPARSRPGARSELELSRAAQKAVALAQQEKSTWTRADLIKYLGRVLPRSGRDPAAAAALLEDLADRALRSEFEPVACLEAPEPAEVPRSLLRADGRSIYQRHGGVRYATHAQLSLEERMLALARATGAPRMTRADAARALGADLAQLEAALAGRAPTRTTRRTRAAQRTRTGLREDQAAAALAVLTDGRRVSVINAPAGSGQDLGAGRGGPGLGRGRARPGDRHHAVPVGPQHPGRRGPGVLQQRPVPGPPARPARRPRPRPAAARRPGPDGRGVHDRHPRPGRRHHPGGRGRRQGDPGRGYPAAAGGGKRRRHVPARRRPRLRPAHRTGPVPRRLGTGRQPAAPRTATPACWPSTTSTAASTAASRSR